MRAASVAVTSGTTSDYQISTSPDRQRGDPLGQGEGRRPGVEDDALQEPRPQAIPHPLEVGGIAPIRCCRRLHLDRYDSVPAELGQEIDLVAPVFLAPV